MRLHITLADELVAQVDQRVGPRRRSAFIARTVEQALDDGRRWDEIVASLGALPDGNDWDTDPAQWVREQRLEDPRRIG